MANMAKSRDSGKTIDVVIRNMWWLGLVIIGTLLLWYFIWLFIINGQQLSNNTSDWGSLGDFVGGIANPVIALFALIGLIRTIQFQQQEFGHLKEELKKQSKHLEAQHVEMENQRSIMQQQFIMDGMVRVLDDAVSQLENILNFKIEIREPNGQITHHPELGTGYHVDTIERSLMYYKDLLDRNITPALTDEYLQNTLVQRQGNNLHELFLRISEIFVEYGKSSAIENSPLYKYYIMKFGDWVPLLQVFNKPPPVVFVDYGN